MLHFWDLIFDNKLFILLILRSDNTQSFNICIEYKNKSVDTISIKQIAILNETSSTWYSFCDIR